jgi:hypothetical protein
MVIQGFGGRSLSMRAGRWCDKAPLFQKAWPYDFASGKAGLTGVLRNKSFFVHEIHRFIAKKMYQPDRQQAESLITYSCRPWSGVMCKYSCAFDEHARGHHCALHACVLSSLLHPALRAHRLIGCNSMRLAAPVVVDAETMPCS